MKKLKKTFYSFILILISTTFFSCNSFLSNSNTLNQIKNQIDYYNSKNVNLSFGLNNSKNGTIYPDTGTYTYKTLDKVVFEYTEDVLYQFDSWEVYNINTMEIIPYSEYSKDLLLTELETVHNDIQTKYSVQIEFLNVNNDYLIKPKCILRNDNTPPSITSYNAKKTFGEKEELTKKDYKDWIYDNSKQDDFDLNHVKEIEFSFNVFEEDSGLKEIIIDEYLIQPTKDISNFDSIEDFINFNYQSFHKQNKISVNNDDITIIKKNANYSVYFIYKDFQIYTDGLIKLDVSILDSNSNQSNKFTYYIIKDTVISNIVSMVELKTLSSSASFLSNSYSYQTLQDIPYTESLFHQVFDTIFAKEDTRYFDDDAGEWITINNTTVKDIWFNNDDFEKESTITNYQISINDGDYFDFSKSDSFRYQVYDLDKDVPFSIETKLVDDANNCSTVNYTPNIQISPTTAYLYCKSIGHNPESPNYYLENQYYINFDNFGNYVYFFTKDNNGKITYYYRDNNYNLCSRNNTGSEWLPYDYYNDDGGGIPFVSDSNIKYYYVAFANVNEEYQSSTLIPSKLVCFSVDDIKPAMYFKTGSDKNYNTDIAYTKENRIITMSYDYTKNEDYNNYYDLYISFNYFSGITDYKCYVSPSYFAPIRYVNGKYVATFERLSLKQIDTTSKVYLFNENTRKYILAADNAYLNPNIDITPPSICPNNVLQTNMCKSLSFEFSDDFISKSNYLNYQTKIYYTTNNKYLSIDEIKQLNYLDGRNTIDLSDSSPKYYSNYDISELEDTKYVFYLYVEDTVHNYSYIKININLIKININFEKVNSTYYIPEEPFYDSDYYSSPIEFIYNKYEDTWMQNIDTYFDYLHSHYDENGHELCSSKLEDMSYSEKKKFFDETFIRVCYSYTSKNMTDTENSSFYTEYNSYPFYYSTIDDTATNKLAKYNYLSSDEIIITSNIPVMAQTCFLKSVPNDNPSYVLFHTLEENITNTKMFIIKNGETSNNYYKIEKPNSKKGLYYTVILTFGDGTQLMTTPILFE